MLQTKFGGHPTIKPEGGDVLRFSIFSFTSSLKGPIKFISANLIEKTTQECYRQSLVVIHQLVQ
jgi:hypothetical protein